jgi:hypothetical protein
MQVRRILGVVSRKTNAIMFPVTWLPTWPGQCGEVPTGTWLGMVRHIGSYLCRPSHAGKDYRVTTRKTSAITFLGTWLPTWLANAKEVPAGVGRGVVRHIGSHLC